jgi:hypothetical protein
MEDEGQRPEDGTEGRPGPAPGESRPQRAGEGGTTRFGMEEGDNSEVPATGGPAADEGAGPESSL